MPKRRDQLLKTWPGHFRDIRSGVATFEVRSDDRGFRVGDHLVLLRGDGTARDRTPTKVKRGGAADHGITHSKGNNPDVNNRSYRQHHRG